jgi:hypothetical protein
LRDFAPDLKFEIGNLKRSHCAKAFTTEGTEDTEPEEAGHGISTYLLENGPYLKFEIGNLRCSGSVSHAGGNECGKISDRENATIV